MHVEPHHEHDHGALVALKYGIARSPRWHAVARAHLAKQPHCVACKPGARVAVQVHHIFPFHYCVHFGRPDLELDERNLVTLCSGGSNHHLLLGHLDDFESADLAVVRHARRAFHGMTSLQLHASYTWRALVAQRLPGLRRMTVVDLRRFRVEMHRAIPRRSTRASHQAIGMKYQ
jgi:hypothetical protein